MRNLTYTLSPHSPFAALTDPLKGGSLTDLVVEDFNLTEATLMV